MRLRTFSTTKRLPAPRLGGRRLLAALALAGVMLGGSAGSSGAGIAEYGGTVAGTPLYLAGPASTVAGGSYGILPTAGPTGLVTPVASSGGAGVLTGSYNYIYTV